MRKINYWFSIATLLISGMAHAQSVPATVAGVANRNFQYLTGVLTATYPTTLPSAPAWNAEAPPKWYTISVTTTAAGFSVALEGSLDNVNWTNIATATGFSQVSNTVPLPSIYFRMRQTSLGSNTAVTATAIGVW